MNKDVAILHASVKLLIIRRIPLLPNVTKNLYADPDRICLLMLCDPGRVQLECFSFQMTRQTQNLELRRE